MSLGEALGGWVRWCYVTRRERVGRPCLHRREMGLGRGHVLQDRRTFISKCRRIFSAGYVGSNVSRSTEWCLSELIVQTLKIPFTNNAEPVVPSPVSPPLAPSCARVGAHQALRVYPIYFVSPVSRALFVCAGLYLSLSTVLGILRACGTGRIWMETSRAAPAVQAQGKSAGAGEVSARPRSVTPALYGMRRSCDACGRKKRKCDGERPSCR